MEHKREREYPPGRISWHDHERDMCRLAKAYKSAIKVLVLALLLTAAFAGYESWLRHREQEKWLNYLEQYDFESYDYTQDGEGLNIIGDGNGAYYVAATKDQDQGQEEPCDSQGPGAEKAQEKINREKEPENEV